MDMDSAPGTDVVRSSDFPLYNPDNDFRQMALDTAYYSEGFRLIDKEDLEGVPFVVKRIVYREGFPRDGSKGDYISVECIVADARTLDSEPVKAGLPARLAVFPNEGVVFNDSGTGVRRQLTEKCAQYGIIDCGKPADEDSISADKPFQLWAHGAEKATTGISGDDFGGKSGIYLALRGLRRSDYLWNGQEATTYYFG